MRAKLWIAASPVLLGHPVALTLLTHGRGQIHSAVRRMTSSARWTCASDPFQRWRVRAGGGGHRP